MSEKKVKEPVVHTDKLGRELQAGMVVAYPDSNSLQIGRIERVMPKMIRISRLPQTRWRNEINKYPHDTVFIDSADVTMYVLKAATK